MSQRGNHSRPLPVIILIIALAVLPGSFALKAAGMDARAATFATASNALGYQDCILSCTGSAPQTGTAGVAVSMSASATTIYCTGSPSYTWNFGDGTAASSDQNPSHAYARAGAYSWTLTARADASICTQTGSITISAATRAIASVSAASYSGSALASEVIAAAFGSNLAGSTQVATTLPLPTELAGTNIKVKDSANVERLAPLFFVAPGQVNYLIPPGTAIGAATVKLTSGDGGVATGEIQIGAVAPGLFSANASGQGVAAAVALRVKADNSQSFEPVARFDAAGNRFVSTPIDLGPESEQVFLLLFGTGIRYRSALAAVSLTLGGENSEVSFAGPQGGFVGLDQVNARIPRSLAGRGEVDLALRVDGQAANIVRVNIR